jgi:plasmid stabilization system protein ParE
MPATVIYSSAAIKELEQSSDWYENHLKDLGKRFVLTIRETLILTSNHPEAFPKTKAHFREVVVDGFPFVIVYRYDKKEDIINVLHVFHTSRNPKFKYKRS